MHMCIYCGQLLYYLNQYINIGLYIIYKGISSMQQYDVLMELGSGSFGRVVKAKNKKDPDTPLAIKMISLAGLSQKQRNDALNQVRLLASIHSPNVISYHNAFFDNQNQNLCIVMQYADGGDLAGLIKRKKERGMKFNQNFIWQVSYDLLKALNTLHKNSIIHRDLKPGNIFFVNGVAKLGDLNISKATQSGMASTQAGTPFYTSPQIWNGVTYDIKCDIWSFGCLMYECAALRPPFVANDFPGLCKKINLGYFDPIPAVYSQKMEDIIRSCLRVNFRQRPNAGDIMKDSVFQYMHQTQEGSVSLINTIRCPRVLKMLQQKLPDVKSACKRKSSLVKESFRTKALHPPLELKKVVSQQKIRQRVVSHHGYVPGKQNDKGQEKVIQLRKQESPNNNRGVNFRIESPRVRQRGAQSPAIYRRVI